MTRAPAPRAIPVGAKTPPWPLPALLGASGWMPWPFKGISGLLKGHLSAAVRRKEVLKLSGPPPVTSVWMRGRAGEASFWVVAGVRAL